jgi:hypothetical protein
MLLRNSSNLDDTMTEKLIAMWVTENAAANF